MRIRIDRKLVLFSIVTAFFLLLICTKNSPLYPFNDWVDVHCFLTIGRGIKHGLVPYRDLYEQKGPFLYFIVALATYASEKSFIPLFVIEVLAFSLFIYQTMKIVYMWTECKVVYVAAPLVYMTIVASRAFDYGFSAEELCLPFLAWSLRIVLSRMREDKLLKAADYFTIGTCAAVAFWTKYVFCGYFAGLALIIGLWYVTKAKTKEIIRALLWASVGFMVITAPILIWYAAKGGLIDLFQAYFYNNIMIYSEGRDLSAIIIQLMEVLFQQNILWFACSLVGISTFLIGFKKNRWEFLVVETGWIMLVLFITMNRFLWPYYTLILSLFTPFVLIPVGIGAGNFGLKSSSTVIILTVMAIALSTGISYYLSPNTYLMGQSKAEMPQYEFATIMLSKKDNPSLLNYDFLDGGFYYAAGIMPINRFSCKFNVELPEQMEEQDHIVKEGLVDFVVTRDRRTVPGNKYRLKERKGYYSYPGYFDYYLFERISEGEVSN